MVSLILRFYAIMFGVLMSSIFPLSFFIYSSVKKIKFKKVFFLGILSYVIRLVLIDFLLYKILDEILNSMDLAKESFLFFNKAFFILYLFMCAFLSVLTRFLFFRFCFKKNEICFYDMISFSVGYSVLYNFLNGTIPYFKYFKYFLDMRAIFTFIDSFGNILFIITDVGFCCLVLYLMQRKTKFKYLFLFLVVIFDTFTCLVSSVLVKYGRYNFKLYYNSIFLFILSCLYFFVTIILKDRLKKGEDVVDIKQ